MQKIMIIIVGILLVGAGCTSASSNSGVLDITGSWNKSWPGEAKDSCVSTQGHGGLTDQCYDPSKEEAPVFTMEFRIPDDLCTDYYRCRVVDNTCTTVLHKKPWENCHDCYNKCKKGDGYDDACFKQCVTDANKEFREAR